MNFVFARSAAALVVSVTLALGAAVAPASAQATSDTKIVEGYVPAIWIDPDGCEHWVMDDGIEGYMDIRRTRDGRPVCHRNVCADLASDQLFATGNADLSASGVATLEKFFRSAPAESFIISGHTDSRASDAFNMDLSKRRANAVAAVARSAGANIRAVNWHGERRPRATNSTAAGMAKNRRVEIICVK